MFILRIFLVLVIAILSGERRVYAQQDQDNLSYKGFNVILIAINNIGAEHMSLYGYRRDTNPKFKVWAKDALIFENAYSPASWTLPVITTVFTALNPYTHKVMDRYFENTLSTDIKTLPQVLAYNGYATAAFTGGLDDNRIFGHMRGFSQTDANPSFTGFAVTLKQARKWLARNSKNKFFLFVHGYDAHPPFTPPRKFRGVFSDTKGKDITIKPGFTYRGFRKFDGRYQAYCITREDPLHPNMEHAQVDPGDIFPRIVLTQDDVDYLTDLHDETILSVDSQVTKFLGSLDKNLLKKTIIVVFSEHGEMFAKHGRFGRVGTIRGTLYDDVVHIPLLVKIPGLKNRRITGLVQLADIMPTILDLLDIPFLRRLQGRSLVPLIKHDLAVNDYVYSGAAYNFAGGPKRPFSSYPSINESIRNQDWKLIHEIFFSADTKGKFSDNTSLKVQEESFELYDLNADPNELNNVRSAYPEKTKELTALLAEWSQACRVSGQFNASTQRIPDKMIKDAREHGYW
ncbi:MAG: sulfatase [Candidatus Omnitrophica bacterium]|jgi:arylsulfatase A-like enzyme|nr:sulfatase-like hydrolase/transferase [Candidatus Omnitrophota bacterium]MDD5079149.1 sulfatase [Candidatus Omnitrophota bacterium]